MINVGATERSGNDALDFGGPIDGVAALIALGDPAAVQLFDPNVLMPVKLVGSGLAAVAGLVLYMRARNAGL